jgi:hypothetical protein
LSKFHHNKEDNFFTINKGEEIYSQNKDKEFTAKTRTRKLQVCIITKAQKEEEIKP